MKISSLCRDVAGAAIAVTLAGCGGSPMSALQGATGALPFAQPYVSAAHVGNLNGEIFTAKSISVSCDKSYSSMHFTAKGKATGPLPGTFRASGVISPGSSSKPSAFGETFAIASGSRSITGHAEKSGNKILLNCVYLTFLVRSSYRENHSHGRTQLQYGYPADFGQSFH